MKIANLSLIICRSKIFQCLECKKKYHKDCNKELIKRFANIYAFWNRDINKSILLLITGVYPYQYKDSRERFNETALPNKKVFTANCI